ncbi:MAG TPA: tetratricopeptide repeat protein, partial [Myxococcaceae bacterium]|nr:tetratricopeptide repeat protein [Myxococcaceae bacterium]
DRRLGQLRATTELLAQDPGETLLSMAVQMVQTLPPLETCQSEQVPMMRALLPESPELRTKVRSLLERMDPLEPLYAAGRYQEALALYEELQPEIEQVNHVPLRAHSLWLRARLEQAVGRHKEAEASAEQSLELANRGGHALQVSQAWNLMVLIKGVRQNRYQLSEILLLDTMLESMSELTGDDRNRVISLGLRASLLRGKGEYEEARKRYERAAALAETTMGLEAYFPDLLNNMGVMYKDLGRHEDAKRSYERSLELRRKAFGPEHPEVANSLINLSAVLKAEGRYKDARAMMEQALALLERALGPKHPEIPLALNNLASMLQSLGQHEEALTLFERARARLAEEYGEDHPKGIIVHINLCSTLVELGRYEEARAKCERALALGGKGMSKYFMGLTHHYLGRVFVGQGRNEEARAKYEQALALLEEALGTKHPACVDPLLGLAELHLARRKPSQALALLERATEIAPQSSRSEVDFLLARALWESGKDRARAPDLATAALRHYQELGHPKGEEVRRWLAAHSLP